MSRGLRNAPPHVSPRSRREACRVGFPSVSVVMLALNEDRNIPHVLERIPEDIHQAVLVDGGSIDGTVEVTRRLRSDACLVSQIRKGKGNALVCGFAMQDARAWRELPPKGSGNLRHPAQQVRGRCDGKIRRPLPWLLRLLGHASFEARRERLGFEKERFITGTHTPVPAADSGE